MSDKKITKGRDIDALLSALQRGEAWAMEALYEETYRPLYALCFSYTHNGYDAEDALHDAYIKIKQEIGKYRGKSGFNWVYTVTKNICLNGVRRQGREEAVDFSDEAVIRALGEDPDSQPQIQDESGILALAKEILRQEELAIVVLHTVSGLKFAEIARAMDKMEATVRWSYNNALKKIRKEWERRNQG